MRLRVCFLMVFSALVFARCEKVIDIPLDDVEKQIVVEGIARNFPGESYVLLSRTVSSDVSINTIERLSGAVVAVRDNVGNEFLFEEDAGQIGKYIHPSFAVEANRQYYLTVDYQGVVLSGTSTSLTVPQIDSLSVFLNTTGFGSEPEDSNYVMVYTVTDNAFEKNYYRFVVYINGVKDDTYFIETDDLGNGETYTAPFFGLSFDSHDTVYAELWSMDKANYAYFSGVYNVLNQSPFSAAPGNPPSNIQNGIGHFGAFMIDTVTIIIP